MPAIDTSTGTCSVPLCLALANSAPTLGPNITAHTDADTPSALITSRAPGPARSACDRQMVPAERKPCCGDTNQTAKDQVEAEVPEVGKSCARNINGRANWCQDQHKGVDWWRSRLISDGDYGITLGVAGCGEGGLLFMDRED